jgi:hypothetical protein
MNGRWIVSRNVTFDSRWRGRLATLAEIAETIAQERLETPRKSAAAG